jgi:hypothetical protein
MPPTLNSKSKGKAREPRRSRSRNTTPSSGLSTVAAPLSAAGYLDTDVSQLLMPGTVQYSDVLEKLQGSGQIPDSKTLESLVENLNALSELADLRGDTCNAGMRELSQRRKELERELMDREVGEMMKVKVEADEEEGVRASKGSKLKKKKEKAGSTAKEERPLTHGAHGLARQDGLDRRLAPNCFLLLTRHYFCFGYLPLAFSSAQTKWKGYIGYRVSAVQKVQEPAVCFFLSLTTVSPISCRQCSSRPAVCCWISNIFR